MPLTKKFRPFSLAELDVTVYGGADGTTLGTPVKMDAQQTLTVEPQADEVTLTSDGQVIETVQNNKRAAVTLGAGGMHLEVVAAITGGTLTTTGTTPNQKKKLSILGTTKPPYVRIRGREILPDGLSDQVTIVHYAKFIGGPTGGGTDGQFRTTGFTGTGLPHPTSGVLLDIEQNETAAALPGT
jgi:hypothetical protein